MTPKNSIPRLASECALYLGYAINLRDGLSTVIGHYHSDQLCWVLWHNEGGLVDLWYYHYDNSEYQCSFVGIKALLAWEQLTKNGAPDEKL